MTKINKFSFEGPSNYAGRRILIDASLLLYSTAVHVNECVETPLYYCTQTNGYEIATIGLLESLSYPK